MASMMVDEPGNSGFNDKWWRQRPWLRRWPTAAAGSTAVFSEPGGSGFDSGSDGGGSSAGKRAMAVVASMMFGKPDDNNFDGGGDSGGSSKRCWEMGGGDNFDDGQKARQRLASRAGKQLPTMGNR
ncbi:hypothetical protein OsI_07561 [Oryza sativa Indica Group]|uniref:Uncharacterized protein n=1 Tax=Oryza sativa subsp. indica TaxID=39946 RepID=A2X5S4_ORYSI|nr:hypothetical protein OsI_07561 [Oryza sativa Indica Group]